METHSTSKYFPLAHGTLHYLDYGGPGPRTLVLLHGGGANAHWFDFIGPQLAQQWRVLAVDLRGHGDSSHANPPVYTYEAHIQDLHALFHAERLQQPLLLGHSMGGVVAVTYAGTWPQELGALLVCDSRPVYSAETTETLQQTGRRPGREYLSQEEYIAHFRIRPDGLRAPRQVHEYVARFGGRQLPNGLWGHKIDRHVYALREPVNTLPFWKNVLCPVLMLRAGESSRLTGEAVQQIQDACPHAEWADVLHAGHHLILDQPEQTVTLIQNFLQRHGLLNNTATVQ